MDIILYQWRIGQRNRVLLSFCITLTILALSACSDLVNNVEIPPEIVDPAAVKTARGAQGLYEAAIGQFGTIYSGFSVAGGQLEVKSTTFFTRVTGLLTDELQRVQGTKMYPETFIDRVDSRLLFNDDSKVDADNGLFAKINGIRTGSQEARGTLVKYAPLLSPALRGHLLAIEGVAAIMLAELYCSGIPLSRLDFERDYTLTRGFTTSEVYQHALLLFDSAASLVRDSVSWQHFVQLGRARAYLGLGYIDSARNAIAAVPTDYRYAWVGVASVGHKYVPDPGLERFGDVEGGTGLPFLAGGDPRTLQPDLMNPDTWLFPATGIDARLIEAESQLMAGDTSWLVTLNELRTTCERLENCPSPAPAGSGHIGGLPPLTDPAPGVSMTDTAGRRLRLDMVFAERGYWLFLTGRRQGDLRRLVRNYGRPEAEVYPSGLYWLTGYGHYTNLPVPTNERQFNPHYRGCENRDA